MIYTIENENLKIAVNSAGAQLYSVYSKKTDTEYLWQGSPEYWTGRAYNLFPFIGRRYTGIYRYNGKEYKSRTHGIARYYEFLLEERTARKLVFLLKDSEETRQEYPFAFEYRVIFELLNNELSVNQEVVNVDTKELICGFGGHPGINVPFGAGCFEDYYLEFGEKTAVKRLLLDENNSFMSGESVAYPLVDGVKLPLTHNLFDNDAVILSNTSRYVAVKCTKESRYVAMRYDDFKHIGFWHVPQKKAPYVCLEPWSSLPAKTKEIEDLETAPNMTHVPTGKKAAMRFVLEIHE